MPETISLKLQGPQNSLATWFVVFLLIYFSISTAAFFFSWSTKEDLIKRATACVLNADISCEETGGLEVTEGIPSLEWHRSWVSWDLKVENWREISAKFPNSPDKEKNGEAEIGLPACPSEFSFATFSVFPPTISQNATYESYSRALESCVGRDEKGNSSRLCSGTRLEAKKDICELTLNISRKLYEFDRQAMGLTANALNVFSSIVFGVFQLGAASIVLVSLHRAMCIGAELTSANTGREKQSKWFRSPGPFETVSSAIKKAKDSIPAGYFDPGERLKSSMSSYRESVSQGFDDLEKRGDYVVQLGLLGTLFGMVFLFASLERGNSAIPLEKQLALSSMLGSLGLAFGTTIFAIFARLVYMYKLGPIRNAAMGFIDQATSAAVDQSIGRPVGTETPERSTDLFSEGRALLGVANFREQEQDPKTDEKTLKTKLHYLWPAAIILFIAMAGFLILALTGAINLEVSTSD